MRVVSVEDVMAPMAVALQLMAALKKRLPILALSAVRQLILMLSGNTSLCLPRTVSLLTFLAKLLPGDDVIELEEPVVGGNLAYRFVKRTFDVISCGCALVILAIPMSVIAVKIKSESPGPVIFAQRRVGKGGRIFNVYKFRSMYIDAEARGARWAQGDDPRVTPFGKVMRKTRMDEIPQFWNVLKGDIPLRILKTRPEFFEKSMGAFALPTKSSTNKGKAFSQVVSCFASSLRIRRISEFNCNRIGDMETQFLAKPVFGAVCA